MEILSGVFEGKTTGTPISLMVKNTDQRSHDYSEIANYYRPGHADRNYDIKYGFRDYRGGGRSSGRETIGRVAAGAVAAKMLKSLGIQIYAYTLSIGPVAINNNLIYRKLKIIRFICPMQRLQKKLPTILKPACKNKILPVEWWNV